MRDQTALFAVSAAFGLGLAGLLPAYVIVIRDIIPSRKPLARAHGDVRRVARHGGGAAGAPAWCTISSAITSRRFAIGMALNLLNLAVVLFLVARQRSLGLQDALA